MAWQYRSPREKLFLSDGKDAWFYLPGDRQVRKTPVRKLDDLRSPLGFLLGKTRLEKELHGLSAAPDVAPLNEGDMVLRGVPKTMADRDRKSTRLNSSHRCISYAVFCLKKKKTHNKTSVNRDIIVFLTSKIPAAIQSYLSNDIMTSLRACTARINTT